MKPAFDADEAATRLVNEVLAGRGCAPARPPAAGWSVHSSRSRARTSFTTRARANRRGTAHPMPWRPRNSKLRRVRLCAGKAATLEPRSFGITRTGATRSRVRTTPVTCETGSLPAISPKPLSWLLPFREKCRGRPITSKYAALSKSHSSRQLSAGAQASRLILPLR